MVPNIKLSKEEFSKLFKDIYGHIHPPGREMNIDHVNLHLIPLQYLVNEITNLKPPTGILWSRLSNITEIDLKEGGVGRLSRVVRGGQDCLFNADGELYSIGNGKHKVSWKSMKEQKNNYH